MLYSSSCHDGPHFLQASGSSYPDNNAVVGGPRKSSIRGPAMGPLRQIAILLANNDIELKIVWIPTGENTVADCLSRGDYARIADICPLLRSIALALVNEPPEAWFREIPLPRSTACLIYLGLSEATRRSYAKGLRSYRNQWATYLDSPALPDSLPSLLSWATALATQHLAPSTIKAYLGGVRSFHIDVGYCHGLPSLA